MGVVLQLTKCDKGRSGFLYRLDEANRRFFFEELFNYHYVNGRTNEEMDCV